MFQKLKQFKQLREKAQKIQKTLAEEVVTGSAGFGKVKITMDANCSVQKVEIDGGLLSADNKEKLETTVKDAANDAVKKAQSAMAQKMKSMGNFDLNKLMG